MTTLNVSAEHSRRGRTASANFRDPAGLLFRMLRSRDSAAWAALSREALRCAAAPVDFLLKKQERQLIANAPDSKLPTILIVGAPRSGTTILYQVLSRYLSVSYLNNLTALFPSSPISATRWFNRLLPAPGNQFRSYYGQTPRLAEPNDGFHLWDRWFGADRAGCSTGLDDSSIEQMRQFLAAWHAVTNLPFLNKNNRNTACMTDLNAALPNVFFVVVRREPLFVVQSLIQARRTIQGNDRLGWGLMKQDVAQDAGPLAHVDAVCDQVIAIERMITSQQAGIGPERCIEVDHEAFCTNPVSVLTQVAERVRDVKVVEQAGELVPGLLKLNRTVTLDPLEAQRASERLARMM